MADHAVAVAGLIAWTWTEPRGERIVLSFDGGVALSGLLDAGRVAALERFVGMVPGGDGCPAFEEMDLGPHGLILHADGIVELRFIAGEGRLDIQLVDGRTTVTVAPSGVGIAEGLFETLRTRLASGAEIRVVEIIDEVDHTDEIDQSSLELRLVAALGGLGLVAVLFDRLADQNRLAISPVRGIRSALDDFFSTLGLVPAIVLFSMAFGVGLIRFLRIRTVERRRTASRVEQRVEVPFTAPVADAAPIPDDAVTFDDGVTHGAGRHGSDPLADLMR